VGNENHESGDVEKLENEVRLLADDEDFEGLHELANFQKAEEPHQTEIASHSYEPYELGRLEG
jgi:hypothetical protein